MTRVYDDLDEGSMTGPDDHEWHCLGLGYVFYDGYMFFLLTKHFLVLFRSLPP
jgi:hypothetical protein